MTIHIYKSVDHLLLCIRCNRSFVLSTERKEDITISKMALFMLDKQDEGYALFRDRTFVLCPYCKVGYCRKLDGTLDVEVRFQPGDPDADKVNMKPYERQKKEKETSK